MKTTDQPVIVTQVFEKPVQIVWSALTNRSEMVQWFFNNIPNFRPEIGFKTRFNVEASSRDFLHLWEVTEVIPLQKIVVNWRYKDCAGDSFVIMKLEDFGSQTKFELRTQIIEDFDDSIPEFKRESCVAGWNYFINENLKTFLENKS